MFYCFKRTDDFLFSQTRLNNTLFGNWKVESIDLPFVSVLGILNPKVNKVVIYFMIEF